MQGLLISFFIHCPEKKQASWKKMENNNESRKLGRKLYTHEKIIGSIKKNTTC